MRKLFFIIALTLLSTTINAQVSKLNKNGFYVDALIGSATVNNFDATFGGGVKIGNIWYFTNVGLWNPGLKTTWFRGTTYFGSNEFLFQGSALNVGFANMFKFNEKIGLEANVNLGYNVVYANNDLDYSYDYYYNDGYYNGNSRNNSYDYTSGGVMINPEVKFRYKVLAVGLDAVISPMKDFDSPYKSTFTSFNLSVGAKF